MRKVFFSLPVLLSFLFFLGGCGTVGDDVAPTSALTDPPDKVFFNGSSGKVRFSGTASDNLSIDIVQISFDDGTTWKTATKSGSGSSVTWSYLATAGLLPAGANTVKSKAFDKAGNVGTPADAVSVDSTISTSVSTLESIVSSGTWSTIYFSSGSGDAYGDSSTAVVLENTAALMIQGNGYGQAITSANYSASDMTPATVLETTFAASRLFSVGHDLSIKNLRVVGAISAVDVADVISTLDVTVDDSVFTGQKGFAIDAADSNAGDSTTVSVSVTGTMIDNTLSDANDRGGISLQKVTFAVEDSMVTNQWALPIGVGGGIYVDLGSGYINSSVFVDNSTAIYVANGSPRISSCVITGSGTSPSNGIRFTGVSASPIIRYNTISANTGFGVGLLGNSRPVFTHNTIANNGNAGIYIDFDFTNANDVPVLGDCTVFNICQSGGRNGIFNNSPYEVIVTSTSSTWIPISAEGNFWGTGKTTSALVDLVIQDGDTTLNGGSEDFPLARAYLDFSPFDPTDPN